MFTRRTFLGSSLLGSLSIFIERYSTGNSNTQAKAVKNAPIIISTWDFGMVANAAAWQVLSQNGSALDAVEQGAKVAEADPEVQTVGYGGLPDRDGVVTLDACIMDHNYNCGAVMCLEEIKHPISVARLVMEKTPHIILVGEGAQRFAVQNGFKKENLLTEKSKKDWQEWLKTANYKPKSNIENKLYNNNKLPGGQDNHDTIGLLAVDSNGNLSGACTTSGLAYKMHGRVGDSPVIGAGLYVDNEIGSATASGVGEEVIRIAGAHLVVELMRQGHSPTDACRTAVERIIKRNAEKSKTIQVGFLALSKSGVHGAYSLQPGFTYSVRSGAENKIYKSESYYK